MKNNLKKVRMRAGFTLAALGDACGRHAQQIYQLEQDGANPTIRTAYEVAAVLGVDVTDIWPNDVVVEEEVVTVRRIKRAAK